MRLRTIIKAFHKARYLLFDKMYIEAQDLIVNGNCAHRILVSEYDHRQQ